MRQIGSSDPGIDGSSRPDRISWRSFVAELTSLGRLESRLRRRAVLAALAALAVLAGVWAFSAATAAQPGDFAARRGTLEPAVPVAGTLVPAASDTYGAAVPGQELKILWLAEEGTLVSPGGRLIEFDPAPFQKELETARARAKELSGEADQARLAWEDAKLKAAADLHEKKSSADMAARDLSALVNTSAPLSAQESAADVETRERILQEAETRLSGLQPFVAEGFISQEEFRAAQTRRDQAAADLRLARAKHAALVKQTNPDLIRKKASETENVRAALAVDQTRSRIEIARGEAAARVAVARLEEAERQIAEAEKKIRACSVQTRGRGLVVHGEIFEKTGERRKVRVGDAVWGGAPVVALPDLSRMLVEGRVPESEIHRLSTGQRVRITLDAFPGMPLTGALRSIGSVGASDRNESRSFPVTIALDRSDPRFRPGMLARCRIDCGRVENALYVPIEAVRADESGTYVQVVSAFGRPRRRPISVGTSTSQFVEIRSGLKEGEKVRIEN
jgi:RND family efflux transporter MFP subunit